MKISNGLQNLENLGFVFDGCSKGDAENSLVSTKMKDERTEGQM